MSRVLSLPRASRERQLGLLWGFVALALLGLSPLAPAMFGRLPPCFFHRATGLPCLTCGGTRAALALLGGDVGGALHANPLVTVFLLLVVVGGLVALALAAFGRGLREPARLPRWTRAAALLVLAANWLWLIVDGR